MASARLPEAAVLVSARCPEPSKHAKALACHCTDGAASVKAHPGQQLGKQECQDHAQPRLNVLQSQILSIAAASCLEARLPPCVQPPHL